MGNAAGVRSGVSAEDLLRRLSPLDRSVYAVALREKTWDPERLFLELTKFHRGVLRPGFSSYGAGAYRKLERQDVTAAIEQIRTAIQLVIREVGRQEPPRRRSLPPAPEHCYQESGILPEVVVPDEEVEMTEVPTPPVPFEGFADRVEREALEEAAAIVADLERFRFRADQVVRVLRALKLESKIPALVLELTAPAAPSPSPPPSVASPKTPESESESESSGATTSVASGPGEEADQKVLTAAKGPRFKTRKYLSEATGLSEWMLRKSLERLITQGLLATNGKRGYRATGITTDGITPVVPAPVQAARRGGYTSPRPSVKMEAYKEKILRILAEAGAVGATSNALQAGVGIPQSQQSAATRLLVEEGKVRTVPNQGGRIPARHYLTEFFPGDETPAPEPPAPEPPAPPPAPTPAPSAKGLTRPEERALRIRVLLRAAGESGLLTPEITEATGLSQPEVSGALKILREADQLRTQDRGYQKPQRHYDPEFFPGAEVDDLPAQADTEILINVRNAVREHADGDFSAGQLISDSPALTGVGFEKVSEALVELEARGIVENVGGGLLDLYQYVKPSTSGRAAEIDRDRARATAAREAADPVNGTGRQEKFTNPDVAKLVRDIQAAGGKAEHAANGHIRVTDPDGKVLGLISSTPSNPRSVLNDRTRLRRGGLKV